MARERTQAEAWPEIAEWNRHVIGMVSEERYCPDVMKQVSALQGSLERVNRILLQNHLETCVTHAVAEGRTAEIVDELMETMKYTAAVTGPRSEGTLP